MSLQPSLQRTPENPGPGVDSRVESYCEATRELENTGEYEKAIKVLSEFWPRIGEQPKLAGLEPNTAGELLLRAGVLTGIIGSQDRFPERRKLQKTY